jgi:hypothetical protein
MFRSLDEIAKGAHQIALVKRRALLSASGQPGKNSTSTGHRQQRNRARFCRESLPSFLPPLLQLVRRIGRIMFAWFVGGRKNLRQTGVTVR